MGKPLATIYVTKVNHMIMGTAPTLIILKLSCGLIQPGDTHGSMATNTNIQFARPRASLEESTANAADDADVSIAVSNLDMEKQDLASSERPLGPGSQAASNN
ncbi:hypothetical protein FRB96_006155 [Tulasnella sp. 330]|nr:hypothetical protein FRB96_006155 [Tulasnella sp. 330]